MFGPLHDGILILLCAIGQIIALASSNWRVATIQRKSSFVNDSIDFKFALQYMTDGIASKTSLYTDGSCSSDMCKHASSAGRTTLGLGVVAEITLWLTVPIAFLAAFGVEFWKFTKSRFLLIAFIATLFSFAFFLIGLIVNGGGNVSYSDMKNYLGSIHAGVSYTITVGVGPAWMWGFVVTWFVLFGSFIMFVERRTQGYAAIE